MRLKGTQLGQLGFGAGVVLMGVLVGVLIANISVGPAYSAVGPRVFPMLISGALIVVGIMMIVETLASKEVEEQLAFDWSALGWISLGLVAQALLMRPAGFVIASTVLYMAVARAFGGRRVVVEAVCGLILAGVAYYGFTAGLDLDLPAGIFATLW